MTARNDSAGWGLETVTDAEWHPEGIDVSRPHPARVYDYWLGGKDNFAADRKLGDELLRIFPNIVTSARENRALLRRLVKYLVGVGVRQFVDLGTGVPAANNTHEVAQALDPACRVLYVDNDPIVLTHARALLTSGPGGVTDYLDADIRDVDRVLGAARGLLDIGQPVALMCLMTLQFLADDEVFAVVERYRAALPAGSYLALSAPTGDFLAPWAADALMASYRASGLSLWLRSRDQFAAFFTGLDLIPPGNVPMAEWRAEQEDRPTPEQAGGYGAIGRKA